MLIFAAADDAAALREAVATEAGPATSVMNYAAAEANREDRGAAEPTDGASSVAQGACSDDAWIFCPVAASDGLMSATPGSMQYLSPARYQAAVGEVQQWQRRLGRFQACRRRASVSCTGAASTGTVDDLLSGPRHAASVSSTGQKEHLSVLWASVPHLIGDAPFADVEVTRSSVSAAGGGVAVDVSPTSGHCLLCIDVGGMYLASSRTYPAARCTKRAPSQPLEAAAMGAAKKTECASRRPDTARTKCVRSQTEQPAPLHVHHCIAKTMVGEREAQASQRLRCLLNQRFAAATRACPLGTSAGTTTRPLTLSEVWVMPLLSEEGAHQTLLRSKTLGVSDFPLLIPNTHRPAFSEFSTSQGSDMQSFRLARYPPSHLLRLSRRVDVPSSESGPLTMPQTAVLRPRKRRRDNSMERQEAADNWCLGANTIHSMENRLFLHAFCSNGGCAGTSSAGLTVVRLRILERAFLLLSCYFSAWCCAADFDITSEFASSLPGKWAKGGGSYHTFFGTLRRCVLAEDALVQHSVEEEAAKSAASCGSLYGAAATCNSGATAPQHSSIEALFQDGGLEWSNTADTGDRGSERVWPVEELWGLWVRLGWTPPPTWSRVRVGLRLFEGANLNNVNHRCIRELSPRSLLAFLSRVRMAADAAYVKAKQLRPIPDARAGCETFKVESSDSSASADLCGVIGVGLASHCTETIPLFSAARQESSVQLQRLLEFQAALSAAAESGTRPASAGLPDAAAAAPCIPTINACTATVRDEVAGYTPVLSPAARDLAADVAATTVLSSPYAAGSPVCGVVDAVTFELTWLRGVLESPALLIPALGVWEGVDKSDSAAISSRDTGPRPSGGSAWEKEAALLTALLARRPSLQLGNLDQGALKASSASRPLDIPLPPSLSAAEMYCELADVAELRWSSSRAAVTTADHGTLSAASSKAPTLAASPSAFSTSSCCAVACAEVARLAYQKTADEIAHAYDEVRHRLSAANPLAAFLFEHCVKYLQDQNVFTIASPLHEGSSEDASGDPGGRDDCIPRDACAAGHSEARIASSSPYSFTVQQGAYLRGGPTDVPLPEDSGCLEDEGGPPGECDSVSARLAETVVRVVQESKPVVRRMLALIQSYSGDIAAAAAEGHGGAQSACSPQEATATKSSDHQPNDAVAQDVWRCFAPTVKSAVHVDLSASQSPFCASSCAKATAQRLVQAFWANVATATRLRLRDELGALPGSEEEPASDTEEEEPEAASAPPPEKCGGAASSRERASERISGGDWHNFATKQSGAGPCVATSGTLSLSDQALLPASPGFPFLPLAPLSQALPLPTPCTHPRDAWSRAVHALDGAQAMALYMQHILRCSNAATYQSSESRLGSCPFLSAATEAPRKVQPTTAERAALPTDLLQSSLWLQHALFLLSYGLACPVDHPAVGSEVASTLTAASSQVGHPVCPCPGEDGLNQLPPPALAAFRALRCGKLSLDVWIGVALEVYAERWRLSAQAQGAL
ncbi:hypothetical protein LSCM1_00986 [Leishmania martiniquensis]|uniref:Uncharacterized protein n=1 Tax=Leishmania martiniquensis TaxID=1580590 RepID=A0A836G7D2_9TRYP|nr:hypothetical protein LSCM1_00986 [Leishmania martiniquensis]